MSGRVSPTDSVASGRTSKLSKEFYIELAAFSDSIYDRGKNSIFFKKQGKINRLEKVLPHSIL